MKELKEITENIQKDYDVVITYLRGSQNYGLETKESDIDVVVFIKPRTYDLYIEKKVSKTINTKYGKAEIKDIRRFTDLLKKGNPSYIELLFTDYYYMPYKKENTYKDFANKIVKQNAERIIHSIKGMALNFFNRVDSNPKAIYHLYRLKLMLEKLQSNKFSNFKEALVPREFEKHYLLKLKENKMCKIDREIIAQLAKDNIVNISSNLLLSPFIGNDDKSFDSIKGLEKHIMHEVLDSYISFLAHFMAGFVR